MDGPIHTTARKQQAKEAAFIALVGTKRPDRLENDVFAPKDGKPKIKADADILLEHDAEDRSLDVVRNVYFKFLNLDKSNTTFTNAYSCTQQTISTSVMR